jgi:hypothetical protein
MQAARAAVQLSEDDTDDDMGECPLCNQLFTLQELITHAEECRSVMVLLRATCK